MRSAYDPPPPKVDVAALQQWNTGIERSRREYAIRPTASCTYADCPRLADGPICAPHLRQLAEARQRMRRES